MNYASTSAGLRLLELERISAALQEVLALDAYGFQPVEVVGMSEDLYLGPGPGGGRLYTRSAALDTIRYGLPKKPFPAEWNGPLEGGEADDKQL